MHDLGEECINPHIDPSPSPAPVKCYEEQIMYQVAQSYFINLPEYRNDSSNSDTVPTLKHPVPDEYFCPQSDIS